jgi:hypothetical protein
MHVSFPVIIAGEALHVPDDELIDGLLGAVKVAVSGTLAERADIQLDGSVFITMQVEMDPK